jgi:hypothetical protein
LVAGAAALVLALLPPRIAYGGPAPFEFTYKGLYRTTPEPGGDVKVQRSRDGLLQYSFAVQPLLLPEYRGNLSGELPLYAAGYIKALAARSRGFQLLGEGKTRVNVVASYSIYYTAKVRGRTMYGRDALLVPERPGARDGVAVTMLTAPEANKQITSPLLVATEGVLFNALHSFSFR